MENLQKHVSTIHLANFRGSSIITSFVFKINVKIKKYFKLEFCFNMITIFLIHRLLFKRFTNYNKSSHFLKLRLVLICLK